MGRNDAIISVLIKFLIIGLITFKNQMQEKSIMNFIFLLLLILKLESKIEKMI